MNTKTKDMVQAALLIALGLILPQIFHIIAGPKAGGMLLPMHIPVIIGGFLLGPIYGLFIGFIIPILSYLLTGMPPISPMPILFFMLFELVAYGFFSGILFKKLSLNIFVSLIITMIIGRIFYAGSLLLGAAFFGIKMPIIHTVLAGTLSGVPGIIIQIIVIPALIFALQRSGFINTNVVASKK